MQYSSGLQRYFNEHIHLPNTFFSFFIKLTSSKYRTRIKTAAQIQFNLTLLVRATLPVNKQYTPIPIN